MTQPQPLRAIARLFIPHLGAGLSINLVHICSLYLDEPPAPKCQIKVVVVQIYLNVGHCHEFWWILSTLVVNQLVISKVSEKNKSVRKSKKKINRTNSTESIYSRESPVNE